MLAYSFKSFSFFMCFTIIFCVTLACHHHNEDENIDYKYSIQIIEPSEQTYKTTENLPIKIEFKSETGETIHNVNIRILQNISGLEIYNQPANEHVHKTEGIFIFEDNLDFSKIAGLILAGDYTIEAKVWGHEGEAGLIINSADFKLEN